MASSRDRAGRGVTFGSDTIMKEGGKLGTWRDDAQGDHSDYQVSLARTARGEELLRMALRTAWTWPCGTDR